MKGCGNIWSCACDGTSLAGMQYWDMNKALVLVTVMDSIIEIY